MTNMAPIVAATVSGAGSDKAAEPTSILSLMIKLPPSQPKRPAPAVMIIGNRYINRKITALPQTIIGTLRSRPNTTRLISPFAAAVMAKALSRLIIKSASMMVRIAVSRLLL